MIDGSQPRLLLIQALAPEYKLVARGPSCAYIRWIDLSGSKFAHQVVPSLSRLVETVYRKEDDVLAATCFKIHL